MGSMLANLYETFVIRKPIMSLLLVSLVTVCAGLYVDRFELDASADSLTLEDDEDVAYLRTVANKFPSDGEFYVVSFAHKSGDLFSAASLQTLSALTRDLEKMDRVKQVNSILNVPLLNSPEITLTSITEHLQYLTDENINIPDAKKELMDNPLYRDMLISLDGKVSAVQVVMKKNAEHQALLDEREILRKKKFSNTASVEEATRLLELDSAIKAMNAKKLELDRLDVIEIRKILDKYRGEADIFLGGLPMIVVDMIEYVKSDLVVFGGGVFLFLVLTLLTIFRSFQWVAMPLFCCFLTCFLVTGFLGYVEWPVTVISSNFVSLLLIITMSMIIHLIVRYREYSALDPEMPQADLVLKTVKAMSLPCLYTALTTIVAFGSLLVSGIRPVIDFGLMMTIGIALAFLMAFLLFPAILVLLPKRVVDPKTLQETPISVRFAQFTEKFGNALVVACVGFAALCIYGMSQLTVENRFIDYFKESTEIYQGMVAIDTNLGGTTPLDIVWTVNSEAAVEEEAEEEDEDCFLDDECLDDVYGDNTLFTGEKIARFNEIHNYLETIPQIGKVLSIATTMQVAERIKGEPLDSLELAFLNSMFPEDLKGLLLDPYVSEESGEVRFTMRVIDSDITLKRQELLDQLHHDLTTKFEIDPDSIRFTSMVVIYNNMLQSLFDSQIKTMGVVFVGIMFMFIVLFRSLFIATVAIIPNLFAAGVVLGGMGLAGIPLDMMTIPIAAISVGIAVDNTIHYIYRFRMEFPKDRNYMAAVYRSHGSIGKAMYYTSITIILGFSILSLSNFNPTIYFGLFTALAMFIALLGALTLLPQLIMLFKPFGPEGGVEPAEGEGITAS